MLGKKKWEEKAWELDGLTTEWQDGVGVETEIITCTWSQIGYVNMLAHAYIFSEIAINTANPTECFFFGICRMYVKYLD